MKKINNVNIGASTPELTLTHGFYQMMNAAKMAICNMKSRKQISEGQA